MNTKLLKFKLKKKLNEGMGSKNRELCSQVCQLLSCSDLQVKYTEKTSLGTAGGNIWVLLFGLFASFLKGNLKVLKYPIKGI